MMNMTDEEIEAQVDYSVGLVLADPLHFGYPLGVKADDVRKAIRAQIEATRVDLEREWPGGFPGTIEALDRAREIASRHFPWNKVH
jgi:hypothetical protein